MCEDAETERMFSENRNVKEAYDQNRGNLDREQPEMRDGFRSLTSVERSLMASSLKSKPNQQK